MQAGLKATGHTGSVPVAAVAFVLADVVLATAVSADTSSSFCFRHSMEKGLP
jgi:hypothetical protein